MNDNSSDSNTSLGTTITTSTTSTVSTTTTTTTTNQQQQQQQTVEHVIGNRRLFASLQERKSPQGVYQFFFSKQHDEDAVVEPLSQDEDQDRLFVERFWKSFDDVVIVSLFTQLGIVLRLCAAQWFAYVDSTTFRVDNALFVSLPLNCLSCFFMGLIASGDDLMDIIHTRFTPIEPQANQRGGHLNNMDDDDDLDDQTAKLRRPLRSIHEIKQRRLKRDKKERLGDDEQREVQLLFLERRIRGSKSLALFPGIKESLDVMEHYSQDGTDEVRDLELQEDPLDVQNTDDFEDVPMTRDTLGGEGTMEQGPSTTAGLDAAHKTLVSIDTTTTTITPILPATSTQMLQNVGRDISTNISRMGRVTLTDGWNVGTDAQAMSDDLMLGLRDGFCGALSSFSSWNSSMVNLLQSGKIGDALVGYMIGLQLPIVAYRFGQHVAVYLFVWRTRRETRIDERRGYGLRLQQYEHSLDIDDDDNDDDDDDLPPHSKSKPKDKKDRYLLSVRAIVTTIFAFAIIAQITALFFFSDSNHQQMALSLLFSPFGALTRWRLARYNAGRKGFPLGTFSCNLLACALSGSLGSILAGSPGPRERIVLVSMISGFAGSLSSLAVFIVETLRGIDPLLFRFDGFFYSMSTVFWAMVIGLVTNSSVDWAERATSTLKGL